ncbi:hypothetical protein [Paenibacillus whitsoniae]|uniref:Uncharacterized protein n=1 Tax=Paenibacillus whitsoniae TaxID=2496558 RepID=A0A430JG94_9BACL|nr:hypothetical protein [Paenibacillus whitsoniae]RTE10072.1 hypothetical protein EJQ19_09345 [Paenibacillus whitsoniae]
MKKVMITFVVGIGIIASAIFLYSQFKGAANSPEEAVQQARKIFLGQVVYTLDINKGELICYQRNAGALELSCDFVKKTVWGWKWVNGGGHTLSAYTGTDPQQQWDSSWSSQYFPEMKGTPFPLLFGLIQNTEAVQHAEAVRVDISSVETGATEQAVVVPLKNGQKIWFRFFKASDGKKFKIMLANKSGQQLSVRTVDEEQKFSAETRPMN